ncbi:MAG: hypothetical protein LC777_02905, partial [Actinobacteria bacterium]|nr:hypothetical protein [Actinomycetota bacterium]
MRRATLRDLPRPARQVTDLSRPALARDCLRVPRLVTTDRKSLPEEDPRPPPSLLDVPCAVRVLARIRL